MRNPFTLTAGVVACVGLASQVQASDFQVQGIVISDAVIQFPGSGPQFDFRQPNLAPIDFNDFGNPGPRPGSLVILESELSANRVTDVNGFGLTDVRNNAEVTIPNSQITGDVGMDQSAGVRGQGLEPAHFDDGSITNQPVLAADRS